MSKSVKWNAKYNQNSIEIQTKNGNKIRVPIHVKFGTNVIELPVNDGKLYADNAPNELSNLNVGTFTIINQIPTSPTNPTKRTWKKYVLTGCAKKAGIYDKSKEAMVYDANAFTVFCNNWQSYKEPLFTDGGYYALPESEMDNFFTIKPKDLIIFAEIADSAPTTTAEFMALKSKYADCGGEITGAEVYIQYRSNGTPWRTNHIEILKG